jgi:hypothetical protein
VFSQESLEKQNIWLTGKQLSSWSSLSLPSNIQKFSKYNWLSPHHMLLHVAIRLLLEIHSCKNDSVYVDKFLRLVFIMTSS